MDSHFGGQIYKDFFLSAAKPIDQGEESVVLVVGGEIFQLQIYSFLGYEKTKTLSQKGCEKAKILSQKGYEKAKTLS